MTSWQDGPLSGRSHVSFPLRYATLLDGAFVIRKLESHLGRFPTANDIQAFAASIDEHECVAEFSRLRVYFYHSRPAGGTLINPEVGAVELSRRSQFEAPAGPSCNGCRISCRH